MIKLMRLEWKKLKQKSVIGEAIIYPLILMFLPVFFIKVVHADFGQNYATVIELNLAIQMGIILFGASLINQVFIDEYKNKTISLSFRYPFSRQKLFTAKILFIATFVFLLTMVSYLLTGVTTYVIDQIQIGRASCRVTICTALAAGSDGYQKRSIVCAGKAAAVR